MQSIVFLHGWGVSSEQMRELAASFRAEGYDTHTPDLPGFGSALPPEKPWRLDDYVKWLKQYTLSLPAPYQRASFGAGSKGNEKIILFAHSFGGRIAIKFTTLYPELVERLILCASAGLKQKLTWKRWIVKKIFAVGKWWFMGATWEVLLPWPLRKYIERKLSRLEYFRVSGVMRETFKNVVKEDLRPLLKKIAVPTLLIWGTEDTMTPLADGRIMEKEIPGAKLVVIDGANHSLCRTHADRIATATTVFLNR